MDERLINIDEVIYLFKKKLWILILIVGVFFALGFYKANKLAPTYRATAKIFVGKSDKILDYYSSNEIQYYSEFMNTFNEIIRIDDFLITTLEKYKINKTPAEVKNGIGFMASENTPIFTVTYSSMNEDGVKEVLDAICAEFSEQAKTILPDTKPRIIDSVKVMPIMPNKRNVLIIHLIIGVILGIGTILLVDYLDDTVKSKERLEEVLPIPVLGALPKHEKGFQEVKQHVS